MPNNSSINFGGVQLQKAEVARMKTKVAKDHYGKSYKLFMVDFKSGVKVAYKQSPKGSSLFSHKDSETWDSIKTQSNFVKGLEVVGSKKMDNIIVRGGTVNGIDVVDGAGGDSVTVTRAEADNGPESGIGSRFLVGGSILTDKNDETRIKNFGSQDYTEKGSYNMKVRDNNGTMHIRSNNGVHRLDIRK